MRARAKVDRKVWDALVARVGDLAHKRVQVGVLAEKGGDAQHDPDSPLTLIEIAAIHEFGSPAAGIPERSFIRSTAEEHRADLAPLQARLARAVIVGKTGVDQALGVLGQWLLDKIKAKITGGEGVPPPLAAATIAAKGSERPLVDTGRLLGSLTWALEDAATGAP